MSCSHLRVFCIVVMYCSNIVFVMCTSPTHVFWCSAACNGEAGMLTDRRAVVSSGLQTWNQF